MQDGLVTQVVRIMVGGVLALSAACSADTGGAEDIGAEPQQLVKELGERHTLVFEASDDSYTVIERAPVGTPVVLPIHVARDNETPAAVLARYFPNSKLFGELDRTNLNQQPVQGQVQSLSREDFLAGDKICNHKCATAPHTLNPPYPYEWGESCILDSVGKIEGPALEGEAVFWTANSRSEPAVVAVTATLYPANPEFKPDSRTKSLALGAGEVQYGWRSRKPRPDVAGGSVQVSVTGVSGAIYDVYSCSAASTPQPPEPTDPCANNSCVTW